MKIRFEILDSRYSFITAGGLITGLVTGVQENEGYEIIALENVVIRSNDFSRTISVPVCELNSLQIIALIPAYDAP